MNTKSSLLGALSAYLFLLALCGCHRHTMPHVGSGDEWLGWDTEHRQLYVEGYLDGQNAQIDLCDRFDYSIHSIKLQDDVRLEVNETPCQHFMHRYTHQQVGNLNDYTRAYVTVIDDFYKHPECRVMPYASLMEHLDDKEYQSGEALFQTVQTWRPEWLDSFSGFEGMDKCYGARASKPPIVQ